MAEANVAKHTAAMVFEDGIRGSFLDRRLKSVAAELMAHRQLNTVHNR
ncbi:hypothetical protein [Brevundimonas sp.]|nr:hypothetical protein [Brevundimonas sp.]